MEWLDKINHSGRWIKEKYREVRELTIEDDEMIDPNELDEKKFKAIEILMEIREVLMRCKETPCTVAATITNLNICMLQDHLHDTQLATKNFKKCIDLLEKSKLTSEGILPAISANNQLGVIYVRRLGFAEEAEYFLKQAEDLYVKFTEDIKLDPVYMVPIMGIDEIYGDWCAKSILEKLHMSTLYNLADFYRYVGNKYSFVLYCDRWLSRQLSQNELTQNLDYEDWAKKAIIISRYVLEQNKFSQARHHLAAASCILEKYLEILKAKGSRETSESIAAKYEVYDKQSASVARYWAKYGVVLLVASWNRLEGVEEEEDQDSKPAHVSGVVCKYLQTETMEDPRFVELEPDLESITNKITDMYLLNVEDATSMFLNVRKWLDKAFEYYTFENHPLAYVRIARYLSRAYEYLAFFEDDEDRQTRRHIRRIDILEEINEKFCSDGSDFGRKIWIELAETYSTILDLEMNRLQANVTPMAQKVARIKALATNSIKYYRLCLNDLDEFGFSVNFNLDSQLHSYFCIGKLYNKIIISDIEQGIENTQNSLKAYSVIVDYYNNNPEKQKELEKWDFVESSKKYVTLLPLTLNRFKQQKENPNFYSTFPLLDSVLLHICENVK